MTPAEVHMQLLRLQLSRRYYEGRSPAIYTAITPRDQSGQAFSVFVRFEYGDPDARIDFNLDAPLDLSECDWEDRLDQAIFHAVPALAAVICRPRKPCSVRWHS